MAVRDHEPLSWLLLERYQLGELPRALALEVEARLGASAVDRQCLAAIRPCPPDFTRAVRVLVFQAGQRYEPLTGPIRLVGGNQVPLEGAF